MENTIINEITDILAMSQDGLKQHIINEVGLMLVEPTYMIFAMDTKPKPMLCVHLDTINTHSVPRKIVPEKDFELDPLTNILGLQTDSDLTCLGADDRAGVWIALNVIKYMKETGDYKYDVGFFQDEEIGCHGSNDFLMSEHMYHSNTTCYIGLDRRSNSGAQEQALYGDDNKELIKIFEDLGYPPEMGSITDAATLADDNTACVNLSIGYENEHTKYEVLHINCMVDTYNVLLALNLPDKQFISDTDYFYGNPWGSAYGSFDDEDPRESYIEDLEMENLTFRQALEELGCNPDDILLDKQGDF